jgi:hypothetical protein
MRVVERVRDVDRVSQHVGGLQRPANQTVCERLSLEVLHDQKPDWFGTGGILGFADIMKDADMSMIERRDCASLALEPLTPAVIGLKPFGEDLDRNNAIETGIASLVDLAYAA